jgi:hypothetical protein
VPPKKNYGLKFNTLFSPIKIAASWGYGKSPFANTGLEVSEKKCPMEKPAF